MQQLQSWVTFLRDHASDADARKSSDPTESPKHFIDIDNYSEFLATGRIPQTYDSIIALHGIAVVINNGILPWATKASFDSLRNSMQRRDFTKAKIFAADLGHYVADGHMPLHITRNYDGQYSGNSGIHSRYESTMINAFISQIIYTGENAVEITNVSQYIFDYLYADYKYCDSVIAADNYAKGLSGGSTSSTVYKNALWAKSKSFTIPLFHNASNALAKLIYTAWIQAGSPSLITGLNDPEAVSNATLYQNMPNPFTNSTRINYTLKEHTNVLLQVRDINGVMITTLVNSQFPAGDYNCDWVPGNLPAGVYYLVLHTGNFMQTKKVVYSGGK